MPRALVLRASRILCLSSLVLLSGAVGAAETVGAADVEAEERFALVAYDFDGGQVETGPYTVMVFQDSRGSVRLNSAYRHSGTRSVEVTDVAGDGDFAELQGYFPQLDSGTVYFDFALMTAEPEESLNVALAGESHFVVERGGTPVRDGMGFWFGTRDGSFFHHTGGEDVPLIDVLPFTWYEVEVRYRIDAGRYDLVLYQEGVSFPRLELLDQANAVGLPGSRVFKFSFIGDPPGVDTSQVRFYVDDIFVGSNRKVEQDPFVAPGRRQLFIDIWDYYRRLMTQRPGCLPAIEPEDFGFLDQDLRTLVAADLVDTYTSLAERGTPRVRSAEAKGGFLDALLDGMTLWNQGCAASSRCSEGRCATELFAEASRTVPQAKLYPMAEVVALAREGRWEEADALWMEIYRDWWDDPRFPAVSAQLGLLAGDLVAAAEDLEPVANDDPVVVDRLTRRLWSGELSHQLALELAAAHPDDWREMVRTALVLEQRYYVLLWQGRLAEARDYAVERARQARRLGIADGLWLERQGDAAFWSG
ncbi:MAG: hypothetical protein K8J08_05700, partial [Thermoanaerobaculia bacterium]|nr:hypothetical protein [Thermoanaerobaculia bacterium]